MATRLETLYEMDISKSRRSPSPEYKLDDEDEAYEPYVPVIKRRQEKLAKLTSWGSSAEREKHDSSQEHKDAEKEDELRREKARKERTLLMEAQEVHLRKAAEGQ